MTTETEHPAERRLQLRAYHAWTRVANGKPFPTMADMETIAIEGFRDDSVILRLADDPMDPVIEFVGANLRRDCPEVERITALDDVPSLSLLSRFTDTYLQCVANRAPIGFDASFENRQGETISYRGILLPVSSNGKQIDAVWGVTSSKIENADGAGDDPRGVLRQDAVGANWPAVEAPDEDPDFSELSDAQLETVAALTGRLSACRELEGLVGLALVGTEAGEVRAQIQRARGFDLPRVSASAAQTIRIKREVLAEIGLSEPIEEAIVTTRGQFWIIQALRGEEDILLLLVLDRAKGNLARARQYLSQALSSEGESEAGAGRAHA